MPGQGESGVTVPGWTIEDGCRVWNHDPESWARAPLPRPVMRLDAKAVRDAAHQIARTEPDLVPGILKSPKVSPLLKRFLTRAMH